MTGFVQRAFVALTVGAVLTVPAVAGTWVRHADPSFGFEALFPGEPAKSTDTANGVTTTILLGKDADGTLCMIGVSDYRSIPSISAELAADRDNFVKEVKATVTSTRSTTFAHGDKALDALTYEAESATYKFRSIVMVEGVRVNLIVGAVPKALGDDGALDICVKNFRFLP